MSVQALNTLDGGISVIPKVVNADLNAGIPALVFHEDYTEVKNPNNVFFN